MPLKNQKKIFFVEKNIFMYYNYRMIRVHLVKQKEYGFFWQILPKKKSMVPSIFLVIRNSKFMRK